MFIPFHDDNPTRRTPAVTYALVAINVLTFFWMSRQPELSQQVFAYRYGFVPARMMQLAQPHPLFVPIETPVRDPFWGDRIDRRMLEFAPAPRQIWLSLLTCMFLHGGWMHLLGNMWFLWLFGNNVEDRLGKLAYLFLYLAGGLIASGVHWQIDPESTIPVIGASGAVAAVLGAYAVTWPWARISTVVFLVVFITIVEVPALVVLGVWFVAQVLAGHESLSRESSGGVAWWAHVGGFLAGMVLMPLMSALIDGARNGQGNTIAD